MKISAIIPALNEASRIGASVRLAWEAGLDEVLVVDGGSDDGTADIAAAAGCRLITANRGRASQQNAGASQATGDILLFLHADNWLEPGAAEQVRRVATEFPSAHGAFRQKIDANGAAYRLLERGNAARVRWWGLPYGDQGIFVPRQLFVEVGGFPALPIMEDVALSQLLRQRSWPRLLPGPLHVDPRRWQKHGLVRQTTRNWTLLAAFRCGVSANRLARLYQRHDVGK